MMDRRTALTAIAAAPFAAIPAIATTADPAVVAYDRHIRAEAAWRVAYDRINEMHLDAADNNAAVQALDDGPIGREGEDALDDARTAPATTLEGLLCKAKMAAMAQEIDLDEEPGDACDAAMYSLIADIKRMKNTPLTA